MGAMTARPQGQYRGPRKMGPKSGASVINELPYETASCT